MIFECLDIHYLTRWYTSDNVCLDFRNCSYSTTRPRWYTMLTFDNNYHKITVIYNGGIQEGQLIPCQHVLEMKILSCWSVSNSWIHFYIVLNKNWKIYWSEQSFTGVGPEDRCLSWGLWHDTEHGLPLYFFTAISRWSVS